MTRVRRSPLAPRFGDRVGEGINTTCPEEDAVIFHHEEVDLRTTPTYAIESETLAAVARAAADLLPQLRKLGGGVMQYRWMVRVHRPGGMRDLRDWVLGQVVPAGAEALELQAVGLQAPDAIAQVVMPA
jgi:hypothetical protein